MRITVDIGEWAAQVIIISLYTLNVVIVIDAPSDVRIASSFWCYVLKVLKLA